MKTEFPLYAVGEQWPDDECDNPQFVFRLRNPLVAALLEPCREDALHLCVANGFSDKILPDKCRRIMRGLARFVLEENTDGLDLPKDWGYSFGKKFALPDYIWLYNGRHPWTGILRTKRPASLWAVRNHCSSLHFISWVGIQDAPRRADAVRAEREIEDYAVEFVARVEAGLDGMFSGAPKDNTIPKIIDASC
jgi:hypothetical protein